MAKNKGKGRRRMRQNARRDVAVSQAPALNQIGREEALSNQDYLQQNQAYQSAFGGFQDEMQSIPSIHGDAIMGRLNDQLGTLQNLMSGGGVDMSTYDLPVGLPTAEVGAGQNLGAAMGAGAMGDIANMVGRDQAFQGMTRMSGALGEKYARENLAQDLQDTLQGYSDRRMTLADQAQPLIMQRMNELRQQAFENKALKQKMAQDKAFAEYMMGTLTDAATKNRHRRRNRNERGHNDSNDARTPSVAHPDRNFPTSNTPKPGDPGLPFDYTGFEYPTAYNPMPNSYTGNASALTPPDTQSNAASWWESLGQFLNLWGSEG
jgi:hypothetical protein